MSPIKAILGRWLTLGVLLAAVRPVVACAANIDESPSKLPSLVPAAPNTSPDYFCTWNIQGYHSSYASNAAQKDDLRESRMFGKGQYEDWLEQYPKTRGDLFFLMDEGWDLPDEAILLAANRFPSYSAAAQPENFGRLSAAVKARGWRGLGLWMRADRRTDDFWTQRLDWMNVAGVGYWKVDYGNAGGNENWRHRLTDLGRRHAPKLIIETAMTPHAITWADTYRTYDVDVILSVPQTLGRVARLLKFQAEPGAKGIINCEDEVYMGAALGCSYGVMRHSFTGDLPSGRQDFVFPPLTRDVKRCCDEVARAVRWHRIAPAFAVGTNVVVVSPENLKDNWRYKKDESWRYKNGHEQIESTPAVIARGLPLPEVTSAAGVKPYVVASRHPNGAVAVATLGRAICPSEAERQWVTGEKTDVSLKLGRSTGPIGIFGRYHSLTLVFDQPVPAGRIVAQDLAGDTPEDITSAVEITGSRIRLSGPLIDRVGLSAGTRGDKSEPGLVLVLH
jgi:hypothetical protein